MLPQQRQLRADLILTAYKTIGVDAMGIGEHDREPMVDLSKVVRGTVVTRAGVKIGIFSLDVDGDVGKDAAPRITAQTKTLRASGAELVVGLLHGPMTRVRDLLTTSKLDLDIAVVSHNGMATPVPQRIGDTWAVEAGFQGKQLGILDLHIVDGKYEFKDVGQRGQLEAVRTSHQQTLAAIEARAKTAEPSVRDYYEQQHKQVEEALAAVDKQLAQSPVDVAGSWLENRQVPLGTNIADAPEVAVLIKKYKDDIAKMPVVLPPTAAQHPGGAVGGGYLGNDACKTCHAAAVAQWQETKHAQAWASLVKQNQQRDPACTSCHITGNQLALRAVGCESCHGPGAQHVARPTVKGLVMRDPPEGQCKTCHTPGRAPEWEYRRFRLAVLGKGHGKH